MGAIAIPSLDCGGAFVGFDGVKDQDSATLIGMQVALSRVVRETSFSLK